MTTAVRDVPEASRYEIVVDGTVAGIVSYRTEGDVRDLVHTEIDDAFEGQGIGGKLAAGVLDDIRARGLQAKLTCPFLAGWVARHPEYQDAAVGS
jgi:predicted GNAT family acetyltransferase